MASVRVGNKGEKGPVGMKAGKDGRGALPDSRRHAYRQDLADEALKDRVAAQRFVSGVPHQVHASAAPLRSRPDISAGYDTELLFGEQVAVFDVRDGWAWVQAMRDRYVGYLPADLLTEGTRAATHKVCALGTFIYPEPDIKTPPVMPLSMDARLSVAETDGNFHRLATGGFVVTRHVAEIECYARDFVDVAERFLGTPYLWGGRTRMGIDCSGLVQISLQAAGREAPRDSDMQRAELGSGIDMPESLDGLRRGDLIFWKGHVGIMYDAIMLFHANAHHMEVAVEPLSEMVDRTAKNTGPVIAIRRLPAGNV